MLTSDILEKIINQSPENSVKQKSNRLLTLANLATFLGPMIAIANNNELFALEFADKANLACEVSRLAQKLSATIIIGKTVITQQIQRELNQYFAGKLTTFATPLCLVGSVFQQQVWQQLRKIPYGKTCAYSDLAKAINRPSAFRAVARANATNRLALIIPCHRVINSNGNLGGYAGGVERKKKLLAHEHKTQL